MLTFAIRSTSRSWVRSAAGRFSGSSGGGLVLTLTGMVFFVFKTQAEESHLLERYPSYAKYAAKVPRFLPRLGRHR